ncbi:hypothetical protein PVAND_008433 [Polypedilum vanderplanki]|uniref:Uncharacterized protein n=1 Tax=Polypedilum vanderplanki TaxID=319348 RepID=A0A9J6CB26_POLVA|nr:hypothetical protein PVAND_008433 [Polypedilum vanderplanki]
MDDIKFHRTLNMKIDLNKAKWQINSPQETSLYNALLNEEIGKMLKSNEFNNKVKCLKKRLLNIEIEKAKKALDEANKQMELLDNFDNYNSSSSFSKPFAFESNETQSPTIVDESLESSQSSATVVAEESLKSSQTQAIVVENSDDLSKIKRCLENEEENSQLMDIADELDKIV